MTLEQAREFFRKYNGFSFHMFREDPQTLAVFDSLNIPDRQKDSWRLEMAQEYLDKIDSADSKSWSLFSSLTGILISITTFTDRQEDMIIEAIEKQIGCDDLNRTITLETICGRTYDCHDGVIAYFKKHHFDLKRLKDVTDRLIESGNGSDDPRLKKAIALYNRIK